MACIKKMDLGTPRLIHGLPEVAAGKGFAARDGMLIHAKVNQEKVYQQGLTQGVKSFLDKDLEHTDESEVPDSGLDSETYVK